MVFYFYACIQWFCSYGYGAPLGCPLGHQRSAITVTWQDTFRLQGVHTAADIAIIIITKALTLNPTWAAWSSILIRGEG